MEEIKRGLTSKSFLFTLLASALCLAAGAEFGSVTGRLPANYHAGLVMGAMKSDLWAMGVPILSVLPWTTAFVEEVNSGYVKFYLIRTRRRTYLWGKAVCAGVLGGLGVAGGALFGLWAWMAGLSPAGGGGTPGNVGEFSKLLLNTGLTGAVCALAGALLAAWLMSNYMAYIAPFVLYYFLIMLVERYFTFLYCIYPKEWLAPTHYWGENGWGLNVFLALLCTVLLLGCVQMMERRLWDV